MKSITWTILVLILSFWSCHREAQPEPSKVKAASNIQTLDDSAQLVTGIKTFSADVGEDGQKALNELRSRPQKELISDLLRLRTNLAPDDSLQPQLAFVFCYLNYECAANTNVVVSALSKTPKFKNFYADQAAALIGRLMKRGDKSLLPVLLNSVPWSDGALSEELAAILGNELLSDTETFLDALRDGPEGVRLKTYELLHNAGGLSADDREAIKTHLRKIKPGERSYTIAKELLESVTLK
jgi:hypothetical protein